MEGRRNAEIADRMMVSLSTVRFHLSAVLGKLVAANSAEAIALAIEHHLAQLAGRPVA